MQTKGAVYMTPGCLTYLVVAWLLGLALFVGIPTLLIVKETANIKTLCFHKVAGQTLRVAADLSDQIWKTSRPVHKQEVN